MAPESGSQPRRPRVLFLCTGNSCRSQMAEGWARALCSDRIDACSAGTDPHGLNPLAVRAMAECGVDISHHASKRPEDLVPPTFDYVVTVCDAAHESCPVLPGAPRVIHVGFDDPPRLARGSADDDEAMPFYRRVRDEIRSFVRTLPESLIPNRPTELTAMTPSASQSHPALVQVFDPPMCCSSGVCGAEPDPALASFAADLAWISERGVQVQRYNLARDPQVFMGHDPIRVAVQSKGTSVLPMVLVGGAVVSEGRYPSRAELASRMGLDLAAVGLPTSRGCGCGPKGCC